MTTTTTLYKRTHSGLRIWEAQLDPNNNLVVRIRHGAYQGAQQEEVLTHACPEEAQLELNRRIHIKTTKQGYTPHIPDAVPLLPMLVQPYTPHRLPDEVYIQPKMDGFRCIGSNKGLKTRRNEPITSLPHITKALQALPDGVHLDGSTLR